jgi:hypothetical protein
VINLPRKITASLFSALSCLLVLGLQYLGIHSVPSSALVTFLLVATVSTLELGGACGPAIMCGSFVGMSFLPDLLQPGCSLMAREGMLLALLLSFGVVMVYFCIHRLSERYPDMMLNGFGGKLGATALLATLLCTLAAREFLGMPCLFPSFSRSDTLSRLHDNLFSIVTIYSISASVAGAVVPLMVQGKGIYKLSANGRVGVTALWGLCVGGILLLIPLHGSALAYSWYMGTFVSMTALEVISPIPFLMVAGALAPVFLALLRIPFHGFGGVLGMAAFLAVIITYHLEPLRLHLRNRLLPDRT